MLAYLQWGEVNTGNSKPFRDSFGLYLERKWKVAAGLKEEIERNITGQSSPPPLSSSRSSNPQSTGGFRLLQRYRYNATPPTLSVPMGSALDTSRAYSRQFTNCPVMEEGEDILRQCVNWVKEGLGKAVRFKIPLGDEEWVRGKKNGGWYHGVEEWNGSEVRERVMRGVEIVLKELRETYKKGGLERGYMVGSMEFKRLVEEGCREVEERVKEGMRKIVEAEIKGDKNEDDEWAWGGGGRGRRRLRGGTRRGCTGWDSSTLRGH